MGKKKEILNKDRESNLLFCFGENRVWNWITWWEISEIDILKLYDSDMWYGEMTFVNELVKIYSYLTFFYETGIFFLFFYQPKFFWALNFFKISVYLSLKYYFLSEMRKNGVSSENESSVLSFRTFYLFAQCNTVTRNTVYD